MAYDSREPAVMPQRRAGWTRQRRRARRTKKRGRGVYLFHQWPPGRLTGVGVGGAHTMPKDITTTAGPPSPASRIVTAGTTRTLFGPPRPLSVLDLADARCRYSAYLAGGARGLDWYDVARRSGFGPHSALAEARWHAGRERRQAVAA